MVGAASTWEYRQVSLPRGTHRNEARALLTEYAEYGRWELARHIRYPDGRRTIWLRRKVIRAVRTG
jgi:hypothetical protein